MSFQPRHRWSAFSSVALHGLIIALLMRVPEPIPERPPEVEVTIELPPPKPRVKKAKADHKRQPDKQRPAQKPRKAEPHTLEARWEPDKAAVKPPETTASVQLPAVKIETVAAAPATPATARPTAPEPSSESPTPEATAASLQPAPVAATAPAPAAAKVKTAEAAAHTEASNQAGEGGELSLPSSASSQASRSGSTGLDMAAAERPGALAQRPNSGSAALSQSAQRASAADVEPGRQLRAADAANTTQATDQRASTGGGGAALSGQNRNASAAGQAPTDPRPLRVAGAGSRGSTQNATTNSQRGEHGAQPAATPRVASGSAAGTAAGPVATAARTTPSGLGLAEAPPGSRTLVEDTTAPPGMVMTWARGQMPGGYSVIPPVPTGVGQMKMATALAPRPTTAENPFAVAAPAWQATAQRAGAPLPGDGKTIRMADLEVGPATIGLDTGRFKPAATATTDSTAAKTGGPGGSGSDAEASQAGLRASAHPLSGQASGLARANRGQGTQIAAQESAMAGLETTAANAFCKLPTANETNLLKAAKGAPRLISGTPMFNPVWVPPGKLILRVHVLANGEPDQVLVKESSGSNILDEEAVNQIRAARFQPGERDGRITDYWVDLPITYNKPGPFGFGITPR